MSSLLILPADAYVQSVSGSRWLLPSDHSSIVLLHVFVFNVLPLSLKNSISGSLVRLVLVLVRPTPRLFASHNFVSPRSKPLCSCQHPLSRHSLGHSYISNNSAPPNTVPRNTVFRRKRELCIGQLLGPCVVALKDLLVYAGCDL